VVADLPLAIRLAQLAWQTDPNWGQGTLTGLLASFESSRPAASPLKHWPGLTRPSPSRRPERRCLAGQGRRATHCRPATAAFEQLLKQALAVREASDSALTLRMKSCVGAPPGCWKTPTICFKPLLNPI
jgi:hypothetical protein